MSQTIQQRIRQRRKAFGASIGEMAEWAGLPAKRWESIESGQSFSVAELGRVARALAVDPGTFLRGEEGSPGRSVARFRQAAGSVPESRMLEARTLALAAELGRIGGALHRLLAKPLPLAEIRRTSPISEREDPWKQGYRLGAAARKSLAIPVGPIVDLQATLESLGLHIATLPFSHEDIDAASLMEDGAMPVILLNRDSPRVASTLPRRATMAHELCHLLHDAGEHDLETRLSGQESPFDDVVERRARAFAPAFLAPPDEVRHWFRVGPGKHRRDARDKVLSLARRWGFSWKGAVFHAKNCGLIRPATERRLLSAAGVRQDWDEAFEQADNRRAMDGMEIGTLCHGRLVELVRDAYETGAISHGRAREILRWG